MQKGCINKNLNTFDKLDLMMLLTTELPVLRARLGISQEIIAKNIGVSRQTYCAIENGTRKMTWTIFLALVAFFDLNEATSVMLDQIPSFIDSIREILREEK